MKKFISQSKSLMIIIIALMIMAIPFINIIRKDKGNFGPHGYVGGKLLINNGNYHQVISKTLSNFGKVLLMLHVKGDGLFRINIERHPQLDAVSGTFSF